MTTSLTQAVAHVLTAADRPLTVDEIRAQVAQLSGATVVPDAAALRNAFANLPLAASLGGRPARYVWWPNRLAGSTFRLPLAAAETAAGPWPLGKELFLALWPTFFAEREFGPYALTLALPDGTAADGQISFVRFDGPEPPAARPGVWTLFPSPALTAWLRQEAAEPGAALRVQAVDVPGRRYAVALIRPAHRDATALAARNRALAEVAAEVVRAGRDALPDFYLVPRLIARDAYRAPLPPDPLIAVLRADLGFIVGTYDSEALCLDPGHADAWVHLGNICVDAGQVGDALACYERGEAAALARTIGDPGAYEGPYWLDLDSRPYLRALHGKGCCYWQLGRAAEARQVFAQMLRLNPNDNQGARFLLAGLDAGRTWAEEVAWEEQEMKHDRS